MEGNLLNSVTLQCGVVLRRQDLHAKDNPSSLISAGNYVHSALFHYNMLISPTQSLSLLFELPVYPTVWSAATWLQPGQAEVATWHSNQFVPGYSQYCCSTWQSCSALLGSKSSLKSYISERKIEMKVFQDANH